MVTSQALEDTPTSSEKMEDFAPIISSSDSPPIEHVEDAKLGKEEEEEVSISSEELKELSQAVASLKEDEDRTTLEELKEDREEYIEVRGHPGSVYIGTWYMRDRGIWWVVGWGGGEVWVSLGCGEV